MDSPERDTLEGCVCGEHFDCPDGWHYGDDVPCACTPDCTLTDEPTVAELQPGQVVRLYTDVLAEVLEVTPVPSEPCDPWVKLLYRVHHANDTHIDGKWVLQADRRLPLDG